LAFTNKYTRILTSTYGDLALWPTPNYITTVSSLSSIHNGAISCYSSLNLSGARTNNNNLVLNNNNLVLNNNNETTAFAYLGVGI
jgi:hypothetical protein